MNSPIFKDILKFVEEAKTKYGQFSKVDQTNYVLNKLYDLRVKGLESDIVIVLERQKQVIFVETKSLNKGVLKNTLTHAAEQLELRRKVFTNCHKDVLSDEWAFVKVIALPFIKNKEAKLVEENIDVCDYCRKFKRIQETLKNGSVILLRRISLARTRMNTTSFITD